MLEPLIVLTVLNCLFMFSSTVTTCALWWQYRQHSCCTEDIDPIASSRHSRNKSYVKKSKSGTNCHVSNKTTKPKVDGTNKVLGTNKSFTNADEEDESKYVEQRKSKNSLEYLAEHERHNGSRTYSSTDPIKINDHVIKRKISEASQTTNDTKSTMVMEFSTVQKIVQIVDNDDVPKAKIVFIPEQNIVDKNKKYNLDVKSKFYRDTSAEKISRTSIE